MQIWGTLVHSIAIAYLRTCRLIHDCGAGPELEEFLPLSRGEDRKPKLLTVQHLSDIDLGAQAVVGADQGIAMLGDTVKVVRRQTVAIALKESTAVEPDQKGQSLTITGRGRG